MTTFGLDSDVIGRLIATVSGDAVHAEQSEHAEQAEQAAAGSDAERRFALAAWSGLVEPGDGTAGAIVTALGPAIALTALIEEWPVRRMTEAVRDAGADDEELDGLATELTEGLKRWRPRLKSQDIVRSLELAARVGVTLVTPGDFGWPGQLEDLGRHAPIVLWRRGSADVCASATRSVALVGARAATTYGEQVTMEASAGLVGRGYTIVSGAAYGIDGMAHKAALANEGLTVAVLAGGVDRFYPAGHDTLLQRIVESGAVVSEVPCGGAPTKWRFLQRNRIIAAMSCATVVVEAGHRSGSLNTAGHASALGRPLGAVPGPVTSPASAGCHRLIRDYAAVCVTNTDEIVELAGGFTTEHGDPLPQSSLHSDRTREQTRVVDALSARSARPLENIAARAGMSIAAVRAELGVLELDGVVSERAGGWVRG
ncbi:MAG TPA: DNA-processing protein DprA [Microbacteriaceae bacterium]|nr:DNA-processing protein DprA [Microbacteriaceae bacterium]